MRRGAWIAALATVLAVGLVGGATGTSLITGKQIKDGTVSRADLSPTARASQRGPRGRRGLRGRTGPAGPVGPIGPPGVGHFDAADGPHADVPSGFDYATTAACPLGEIAIGTGFYNSVANVGYVISFKSFVGAYFFNASGVTAHDVHVQAICAQLVGATASSVRQRARDKTHFEAMVAAAKRDRGL